ncbi:MAG: peptidase M28 [Alphaproteobacteria bacterium HGW-Alphaproteobacteria-18]|nr:MAG: peptidase M28 [Alphaproteobacteria bacterium HGW-Alphaproteobacteria-18]
MNLKHLTITAAALALVACSPSSPAPETPAPPAEELLLPLPEATVPEITARDIAVRVKTLADDIFEGRGPGTPAGEASAAWIAAELARIGLQPAGDDGSWYQQVAMVNQTVDPATSSLVLTWPDQEELSLGLKDQAVVWTKRQNTDHISFEPSDVVFVGYGAVAPEYGWDDYAGQDYTGKTVLILVNDPGFATGNPDLFNGKAMTYYGRWTYKFEEAARQGATAAIVIHETEPAAYGWDVVANSWTGAQSDLVRPNGGEDRAMMEGWVQRDIAVEMFAKAGLDFEAMKTAARTRGFQPVALEGVKARGEIHQTIDRLESRNVIGILPGTTAPDEYVLYTAHWDHLGMKTGAPGEDFYADQIFNGAVDNATGAAGILEIAEAMKAQTLDRSMMFLFVTLEESGLLGSEYFANNPTVPLNKIVAGVNIDGALPMGRTKDMTVVGFGASELEDLLKDVLVAYDRVITPDGRPEAGYFYRSDHISLAKKGVPMLYAGEGEDKREGGVAAGRAAAAAYTAERYHKPMDEYSDDWDLSGFQEDLQALYDVGLRIANSDAWPTWYPGNEFEAVRKESLAGE